jgi:hypothetical protein
LAGCKIDFQSLADIKGQIVMCNPNISDNDCHEGILIYTPKNNHYLYLAKNISFSSLSFSENKEKILGVIHNSHNCSIIEYNIKTKEIIPILNKSDKDVDLDFVQYVPKSDSISFMAHPYFYVFNPKTKERKKIIKAFADYSWSKDGKKLFYSKDWKTYCLDMESKKTSLYIKGYQPQLSASNDYIAFQTISDDLNFDTAKLVVKEVKTGKEWRFKISVGVCGYRFSPDDKYLAILERTPTNQYRDINLISWDFKNNKKIKLIEHIRDWSGIDWK